MVYDPKTFELFHQLTEEGKVAYQQLLERAADEILFRHEHPVKWIVQKISEKFEKNS